MSKKTFFKLFNFGKVDYNHSGRRINAASLEVEYRLNVKWQNGAPVLYWEYSASGAIWNSRHTDWISGGQNLESMAEFAAIRNVKDFCEAFSLWKAYHLNGMTAGSPAQEAAIKEYKAENAKQGKRYDYTEACEFLKARGLLDDEGYIYEGKPYRYGTAWLVTPIPEADKERIRALLGITKEDEERAEAEARREIAMTQGAA